MITAGIGRMLAPRAKGHGSIPTVTMVQFSIYEFNSIKKIVFYQKLIIWIEKNKIMKNNHPFWVTDIALEDWIKQN